MAEPKVFAIEQGTMVDQVTDQMIVESDKLKQKANELLELLQMAFMGLIGLLMNAVILMFLGIVIMIFFWFVFEWEIRLCWALNDWLNNRYQYPIKDLWEFIVSIPHHYR